MSAARLSLNSCGAGLDKSGSKFFSFATIYKIQMTPDTNTLKHKVETILSRVDGTFVDALETVYRSAEELLPEEVQKNKRKLSSGTSDVKAFQEYLDVITSSISNHTNYRKYAQPQGEEAVRESLAFLENVKLEKGVRYESLDFCITEGATGAISSFFEYLKGRHPDGEVIIACPSYYSFKLSAKKHGVAYKEVLTSSSSSTTLSITEIEDSIEPKTKAIILTQPNNPTGKLYAEEDIVHLLHLAKEKDIIVLFDELFSDLVESGNKFNLSDQIASRVDALNNTVVVKAYSKNRNMPGFRIGYIFSKNVELIANLARIQEERVFFATGSNLKEFIILDSFYLTVKQLLLNGTTDVAICVRQLKQKYDDVHIPLTSTTDQLVSGYLKFEEYMTGVVRRYRENLNRCLSVFGDEIEGVVDVQTMFNAFFKVKDLGNVNLLDFCINLFIFKGVKIQVGPYFGFNQKYWEDKKEFWMRLTYSYDPDDMEDGIRKLIEFKKEYLANPDDFIHLNKVYN